MRPIEVVGSINVDLVTTTPRIPNSGETLKASSFFQAFGGKGANQAVATARMLNTAQISSPLVKMIGAVGHDQFGEDSLKQLRHEGIDHDRVRSLEGEKTGTTVIIVEEQTAENRILFTPGVNYQVNVDQVNLDASAKNNIVLFQLELPLETVRSGLQKAKSMDKVTILNPAPAYPLPDDCLSKLDHLILNESEASILSGIPEAKLSHTLDDAADLFFDKGVQCVVITLGADGVFWKVSSKKNIKGNRVAAHRVNAIDTTAAGDTFVGAYAAYLTETGVPETTDDETIRAAIDFANRAASISVQKRGAQASIPSRQEMTKTQVPAR